MGPFKNLALKIAAKHVVPPKSMTASILRSYLEFAADDYTVEDQPVMFRGRPLVNIYNDATRIDLDTMDDGMMEPMTASTLAAYLELVEDRTVTIEGQPVVNAMVQNGRVVLQTFATYLKDNARV